MADREDFATAVGALIKTRATKTELAAGIAGVDFYGGGLPLNANLADYTYPKAYAVPSATAAASITPALPAVARNIGVMEVLRGSSGGYHHYRWTVIGGGHRGVYENDYQAGTWTGWRKTDLIAADVLGARNLPNGANLNTYVRAGGEFDGYWQSPSAAATATMTGIPAGETSLFTLHVLPGTGYQMIQFYGGGLYWRAINNVSSGTFAPWVRLDQPAAPVAESSASEERAVRTSRARQRVGGRIGTAGVPAIALRFDDWSDEMQAVVMPELRSRNLPAGWAATVAYVETHGSQTWPVVAEWVRDGVELMGHSWTHVNASGDANIRKEIVESADYIEQKVPAAAIDTWVMPGTSAAENTYDGFGIGDKLEHFYSKPAGRMILRRYPVVGGAITGRFLPLFGESSIGRSHITIDTMTAPAVISEMEKARDGGVGYMLMAHPIHIGKVDKITLADFRAVLDWIVTERDAGRLTVLTPRGIAYADASSSDRLATVPNVNAWTGWNSRTGWTESGGILTTTTGGVMVRAINMTNYGYLRGGVIEIAARVRTPTGAVVRTGITGGADRTVDHTLAASTEWQWVRTVATIPNNLADTASLVVAIGRVSGGQVDIDQMHARTV